MIQERWLTPAQVAATLGIAAGTLANWQPLGTRPAFVKTGRLVHCPEAAITEWQAE